MNIVASIKVFALALGFCALIAFVIGCAPTAAVAAQSPPKGASSLIVGGGCFWCVEAILEDLKGVYSVESGYAGGAKPNPTYSEVCSGTTGHAEVVKVYYNPKTISGADILRVFFATHDPTTLNRQGPDSGTQYRSVVFYSSQEELNLAKKIVAEVSKIYSAPIVTTLEPLKNYSRAEEYHQDYFAKYEKATPSQRSQMNAGYCSAIIEPKVRKFREKYFAKLKKG